MRRTKFACAAILAGTLLALQLGWGSAQAEGEDRLPQRVTFKSGDGRTMLVGYLYKPAHMVAARAPAVVMMHGRAGAYSSRAHGVYGAATLSPRHKWWGREWARAGYIAILVDGFGPRGYPQGFPRFSYRNRPKELNEVTVRPLDAYGALAYLRTRGDVIADRIGLQGWSNGGSAAIATMSNEAPGIASPTPSTGFRAALAFYPGCGLKRHFANKPFHPYAPVLLLHGTDDDQVSYERCQALVQRSMADGGAIEIRLYEDATHSFDTPIRSRQRVPANAAAREDAVERSLRFFARYLKSRQ